MAIGVALTGVAAWLAFQLPAATRSWSAATRSALTPFGQMLFSTVGMIVGLVLTFGLVMFISFRIDKLQPTTALALFLRLRRAARRDAVVDLPGLHRHVDRPGVLHLGGVVRRAEPLRLHDEARPVADRARSWSWA